jgi:copper(I)-binding protein
MQLVVTPPASLSPEQSNQAIGVTLNTLKKTLANNGVEIQAGWVRETAEGVIHPHYHVEIIANGSKWQSAVGIAKHIEN